MSFLKYPSYSDTQLSWLGDIPKHWRLKPFFSCFLERKESNKGLKNENLLSLSYGRIVRKDINALDGLLPASFETYQIVNVGDIVFRLTDLQNDKRSLRSAIVEEKGIITSAYMAASTVGLDARFSAYLFRSYDLMKVFYSMGGGLRQSMKYEDMKRLPIVVPSKEEQTQIARFLDHETAKIDALIAEQKRLVELLKEKRQAVISHAVTKGLDPNVSLKDSEGEWLGGVPEHWNMVRLKHVLEAIIDTEHKTVHFVEDGDYPVIRTSNIRDGKLLLDNARRTDYEGFKGWTKRGIPEPGDIIFTREAPAGEACIVPKNVSLCLGQRTVLLKLDLRSVNERFCLFSIYSGVASRFIENLSQGSTVNHLNMADIPNMPMLLPPLQEQFAIAEFVQLKSEEYDQLIQTAQTNNSLLEERRSALISAAVTGKIDVRDWQPPNDESAFDEDVRKTGLETTP